jgi:hypothetical protein
MSGHCDAPGFHLGSLTLMIRSNQLTLVKQGSARAITSKTPPTTPNAHLGQLWSSLFKTLVKDPLKPFDPPSHPRTFAMFSKFHLNTSNSPYIKVVQFAEGHNFHVECHLNLEVELGEKAWSTLVGTIHWRPENNKVGMQFMQKWFRKTPYNLSISCRGLSDLQLSYNHLGSL